MKPETKYSQTELNLLNGLPVEVIPDPTDSTTEFQINSYDLSPQQFQEETDQANHNLANALKRAEAGLPLA